MSKEIHYLQAFSFSAIDDVIFGETVGVLVMTIEGDLPRVLDARTKIKDRDASTE